MHVLDLKSYMHKFHFTPTDNADRTPCGEIPPSSGINHGHRLPLFRKRLLCCIYKASGQDTGWGLQAAFLPLRPVPPPDNFPDVSLNTQSPSSLSSTPAPNLISTSITVIQAIIMQYMLLWFKAHMTSLKDQVSKLPKILWSLKLLSDLIFAWGSAEEITVQITVKMTDHKYAELWWAIV